jgi:C1A family cysteine protease
MVSTRGDFGAAGSGVQELNGRFASELALVERVQKDKMKFAEDHGGDLVELFKSFKESHNRKYESETEEQERYEAFKSNLAIINKMNSVNPLAFFGINQFADITEKERRSMRMTKKFSDYNYLKASLPKEILDNAPYGTPSISRDKTEQSKLKASDVDMFTDMVGWITEDDCAACKMYPELSVFNLNNMPLSFDWRTKYETPVGSQGGCGSCWTFSTAGDVEGKWFLATGEVIELSKQQLVACDQNVGLSEGCNGGLPLEAYQYIARIGGLTSEADYPYKSICAGCNGYYSGTPTCDVDQVTAGLQSSSVAHVGGWQAVALGEEYESLLATALVKNGPISILLNADGMEYYLYGIADAVDECDSNYLDHAVVLVGFGIEDGVSYWIIKNSWATDWGEDGYFRAIRGSNYCGLSNYAITSVVKEP